MKLVLKSFSQDVDFANPDNTTNFLVFNEEDTKQVFRLPVPRETILELVKMVQGGATELDPPSEPEPEVEPKPDEYPPDADVFGGEEEGDQVPESEDQIPPM